MTPAAALAFVRKHGIVLASARGRVPNLAAEIAGEPIRGSWWGHASGQEIFRTLERLGASPDILVCRFIDGKITLVHRRLWAALARVAAMFPPSVSASSGRAIRRRAITCPTTGHSRTGYRLGC